MKVEIVTHCYAKVLPQYAALLHYQLSSLVLHRPRDVEVFYTLYLGDDDHVVKRWCGEMLRRLRVSCKVAMLPKHELFNRAIGRNRAAVSTTADLVWFCDCDYVFGDGCIDALATQAKGSTLYYPQHVQIHKSHAIGDQAIAEQVQRFEHGDDSQSALFADDFKTRRERKPYGGLFIADGDWCRAYGWLDGTDYLKPCKSVDVPFPSFRDDVAFRKQFSEWKAIDLPNLYRLRHSKTTYQAADGLNGTLERKA